MRASVMTREQKRQREKRAATGAPKLQEGGEKEVKDSEGRRDGHG